MKPLKPIEEVYTELPQDIVKVVQQLITNQSWHESVSALILAASSAAASAQKPFTSQLLLGAAEMQLFFENSKQSTPAVFDQNNQPVSEQLYRFQIVFFKFISENKTHYFNKLKDLNSEYNYSEWKKVKDEAEHFDKITSFIVKMIEHFLVTHEMAHFNFLLDTEE